jgi:hypothetical protein
MWARRGRGWGRAMQTKMAMSPTDPPSPSRHHSKPHVPWRVGVQHNLSHSVGSAVDDDVYPVVEVVEDVVGRGRAAWCWDPAPTSTALFGLLKLSVRTPQHANHL